MAALCVGAGLCGVRVHSARAPGCQVTHRCATSNVVVGPAGRTDGRCTPHYACSVGIMLMNDCKLDGPVDACDSAADAVQRPVLTLLQHDTTQLPNTTCNRHAQLCTHASFVPRQTCPAMVGWRPQVLQVDLGEAAGMQLCAAMNRLACCPCLHNACRGCMPDTPLHTLCGVCAGVFLIASEEEVAHRCRRRARQRRAVTQMPVSGQPLTWATTGEHVAWVGSSSLLATGDCGRRATHHACSRQPPPTVIASRGADSGPHPVRVPMGCRGACCCCAVSGAIDDRRPRAVFRPPSTRTPNNNAPRLLTERKAVSACLRRNRGAPFTGVRLSTVHPAPRRTLPGPPGAALQCPPLRTAGGARAAGQWRRLQQDARLAHATRPRPSLQHGAGG